MVAVAAHTYRVPEGLHDAEAAPLFCPGITAYHAVGKARLAPGKKAAIFGMGGVGHMLVQFAALAGAEVVAVARAKHHRDLALRLGAANAHDPAEASFTLGGVDAAFVFAPSAEMFAQAVASVKPGGVVVNGAAKGALHIPFDDEKEVTGSVIGPRREMQTVLDLAASGRVKVVVEEFPLERAAEALKKLKRGEIEARAVLVA